MTKQEFKELTQKPVLLDGATGSNLMAAGMPRGTCTEQWVIEHKDVIQKLQKAYIEAGSNIIYAPTFGGNRMNLSKHHLEGRIDIVTGDIKEAAEIFKPAFFDVITTNPPYMLSKHGLRNPDDAKAIARHEVLCTLDDILRESMRLLQDKGRFYMIHRPFRLTEIMIKMNHYKIEPKRIQFIHPYIDKEPVLVLIEGVRGARPRVTVEPPIIIYEKSGQKEKGENHVRDFISVCDSHRES